MLELLLIIGAVFVFLFLIPIGWTIGQYNFFQVGKQNIKTQWSNLKTEYQRRYDLVLNLVETVKSFKKHEKETLTEVIKARSMLNFKGSISKQVKTMGGLDNLFSKLAVVFEKYPELKANEQHNILMEELRTTEDRINVARTDFNDIVREYNLGVKTFPSSIIANIFSFTEEKYYLNETISDKAPKVSL